jgi:hypothetical protein
MLFILYKPIISIVSRKGEENPPQNKKGRTPLPGHPPLVANKVIGISTKPKPRDSPENLSLMIEEFETSLNAAKASLRTAP